MIFYNSTQAKYVHNFVWHIENDKQNGVLPFYERKTFGFWRPCGQFGSIVNPFTYMSQKRCASKKKWSSSFLRLT